MASTKFQAIKGVRDILPPESALWNRVEQGARSVFHSYGYGEIRLPIFEPTELFARSVGLATDIVSKEMYSFEDYPVPGFEQDRSALLAVDLNDADDVVSLSSDLDMVVRRLKRAHAEGELDQKDEIILMQLVKLRSEVDFDNLIRNLPQTSDDLYNAVAETKRLVERIDLGSIVSLRPEATASVVRAYIEHGMQTRPGNVKLYYIGPMFRRERPQKGRYRQFYQIGAELLGPSDHPALDAEVIEMLLAFFARVNLHGAKLYINSIGDKNCRPAYVERLRGELQKVRDKLGPDSQRRIETNPLRVLDSKLPEEQPIIDKLPHIADHLCDACRAHYAELKRQLELRKIEYEENWRLVRGLDYYMRTTFEITAPGLGSQNAVCGGGRYDGLVELLGGPATTKGIGFAIGTDRLMLSLQEAGATAKCGLDAYIAWMGAAAYPAAVALARNLREHKLAVELPAQEMKFGKSLSLADRLGARFAVILGEDEVASGQFTVKRLADGEQKKLAQGDLLDYLVNSRKQ
ncbi:MAG TPA: histidine--tRNA ligase [Candidatus Acidoferrales bacterium]|nr:histidine--tRNA ligase [Candidatus Acidoferrales bacterium]